VREPSLGVPERNGKVHRLVLRRETGFDTPILESTSGLEPLTCSLRVITQALQGLAQGCKSCIDKPTSFLSFALCCTVLRSRWYQSGIKTSVSYSLTAGPMRQAPTFGATIRRHLFLGVAECCRIGLDKQISLLAVARRF
jgi:hypothetical protein